MSRWRTPTSRGLEKCADAVATVGERRQLFRQPHRHAGGVAHRRANSRAGATALWTRCRAKSRSPTPNSPIERYKRIFSGPRWEALPKRGAKTQRVLWASTSTKNPKYRDVMYIEELIGPDTVNTIPPATLDAFRDHGEIAQHARRRTSTRRASMMARSGSRRNFHEGSHRHAADPGHQTVRRAVRQTAERGRHEMQAAAGSGRTR